MLKFHSARFSNFRALRKVEISFSDDPSKPLTVIRAENRSGKTTMLNALGWILFGDDALPDSRQKYRLHPIDWSVSAEGLEVQISGELILTTYQDESPATYRIIRSTTDVLTDKTWKPQPTDLSLQRKSEDGWTSEDAPLDTISRLFPFSLHQVFLTDGDSTLTFIESNEQASQRRTRVQSAVRSLLQIDLLENAQKHIKSCRQEFSADLSRTRQNDSDKQLLNDMENLRQKHDELEAEISSLTVKYANIEHLSTEFQQRLDEAFQKSGGDPAKIALKKQETKERLEKNKSALLKANDDIASFFDYESSATLFAAKLLPEMFQSLSKTLTSLEESGAIPNVLPSVIADRINHGICICGTSLAPGTPERLRLESILGASEKQSAYSPILVSIKSHIGQWSDEISSQHTRLNLLSEYENKVLALRDDIKRCNNEILEAEKQLESCNLDSLQSLREDRDRSRQEATELLADLNLKKGTIASIKERINSINDRYTQLVNQTKRGETAGYRLKAATDLEEIITTTIARLGGETLKKVSEQMHSIFNCMNVSTSESGGSIIEDIYLSDDYDIIVSGTNGRELRPSTDLSGAQKRALTLSFILSMVKVSGFEAPNIIDTPLGTQSGQFRRNMLEYTCSNSGQLILFLTKDEISGVEDIIDRYAGVYWTLTNKAQQSELLNDLPTPHKETIACSCDIHSECIICARRPLS